MSRDSPLILGINVGETRFGKELRDGGACVLEDGEVVVAIAEERVSRNKTDGGFRYAVEYCLEHTGLELTDFDKIAYSTCVEGARRPGLEDQLGVGGSKLVPVNHHRSHAHSAFQVSGFDRAIVMVIDAGGNLLDESASETWWKHEREQHSYFVGDGKDIELLDRDFERPLEAGAGEIYRAFTHYLGFGSYTNSGKTMALAAYGDPSRFDHAKIFDFDDGAITSRVRNIPHEPDEMISRYAEREGLDFGSPREPGEEITQLHRDIARFLQDELERILVRKVNYLQNETGLDNLVFAGGVALNCVANAELLENTGISGFFVQPAAGDQGQCLGNALYAYHELYDRDDSFEMSHVYFGKRYDSDRSVSELINSNGLVAVEQRRSDVHELAAEKLASGNVVALFRGRSEYGPRALGNRSILADPRDESVLEKLNGIKSRSDFRPYAPSVLRERVSDWFVEDWFDEDSTVEERLSDFMIITGTVREEKRAEVPGITHVDGTARLQVVSETVNESYHDLISRFEEKTGVPMVLNTSFNRGGEPIVETPRDAVDCFVNTDIDYLILEDRMLTARDSADRQPIESTTVPK